MGGSERFHLPDLKNMLSNCIKMPKYSFKVILFSAVIAAQVVQMTFLVQLDGKGH